MKKIFALAAAAMMALAVNAQVYVGGNLGFSSAKADKDADAVKVLTINPEIGYNLSETQSVGAELLFKNAVDSYKSYGIGVYYRQAVYTAGELSFFVQPEVSFAAVKPEGADETGSTFSIGVMPGIKYNLSDKFSVVATCGLLNYSKNSDNMGGGSNFNIGVDNTLKFGLYYNF